MTAEDEQTHFGIGSVADDELARGTSLLGGRYTIQALRGAGGMAMLYLAHDHDRGMDVAFKLIGAKYAGKPAAEVRLRNEGAFAQRIGAHPNVVRPLEVGRLDDGRMFLVTEFVRGPSLADLLAMERRLGTARACRLARDVAAALEAIHANGLVHRDVKPDNILVAQDGDREIAKLIDFGLAGEIEPVGERLTAIHERPGTRLYMAPEQLAGARNAPGFDVYALGITMYEMLCGFAPHESRGTAEMLERKLSKVASIAEHRPDLPADLIALVDGCMAPDPAQRVATAKEIGERLDEAASELAYGSDPSALPRPALRSGAAVVAAPQRSSRVWIWVAAGVAAIGIGVLGVKWMGGRAVEPAAGHETDVAGIGAPVDASARELSVGAETVAVEPAPVVEAKVPVVAPEPVPAPEVAPTPSDPPIDPPIGPPIDPPTKADTPRPKVKPTVPKIPEYETADCVATRDSAEKAAKSKDWRGVLSHATKRANCWADRTVWLRRVLFAHSNLGEWSECVAAGAKSSDPKIATLVQTCRENLGAK